ncbi:hypothetical protein CH063_11721 [Colletotrichum higginsianum]|uniref:Uncharacterized protein n=2 Tax=Colletotrichum higginsianum TaxID=80884 RepID=H1VMK1_COLHI|nr:hypothetical protein CH63R_07344 [Colletotrichum higginsianum IMI 349063]OBR08579.1 hypothetical protein CH63R_07344 [Colletotrichum higginsianum IMI 349063]TIC96069.1 hypothetical protein CH35J_008730 [Colletotrichum higginsianum]GJC97348.1 hypothetical protein ColKHC_06174 [Colletotrichum higginsianum]CCF41455.1 hypothetical protein CH063_11721 [Colletotrichum higginsianum]
MVLLTSSQVSVLLSSAIVVSCTAALFLSGYVIQQRTLNQLREAIKPDSRPSPKASYYVPEHLQDVAGGANRPAGKQQQIVIEVNPTMPEQQQQQPQKHKKKAGQKLAGWTSDMWQKMVAPPEIDDKGGVTRADLENMGERERNIEGWNVKDQKNPDPEASSQKPVSRAERRKMIKEELRRLAESEEKVYYQRRLW